GRLRARRPRRGGGHHGLAALALLDVDAGQGHHALAVEVEQGQGVEVLAVLGGPFEVELGAGGLPRRGRRPGCPPACRALPRRGRAPWALAVPATSSPRPG